MYSLVWQGEVLDYHFKKMNSLDGYNFYCGDIYIGQVFRNSSSWTIVSKTPNPLSPINGLKTRIDAAELLLKMEGYHG